MAAPEDYEHDLLALQKRLSKAMDEAVGLLKRISGSTQKQVKSGEETAKRTTTISKDGKVGEKVLASSKIQNRVLSEIKGAINQTLALQKDSLARGKNIDAIMNQYGNMSLRMSETFGQGLTGFNTAMAANFDLWRGGFKTNNYELARLTVAAKITGQNSQELIRNLRRNTAGTGINNEELSSLANTTLRMQQQFGVTAQELTTAVTKLGESLKDYAVLGIAAEANEAATVLAGALGQEFADGGAKVLAAYTKGDALVQAQILGIAEERKAFLGGDTWAGLDLVVKAGRAAEKTFNRWSTAGVDQAYMIEMAAKFMGQESKDAVMVLRQLEDRAKEEGFRSVEALLAHAKQMHEINTEFTATWDNFIGRVFSPIRVIMMKLTSSLIPFLKSDMAVWISRLAIFGVLVRILPNIAGKLAERWRGIKAGLSGLIKGQQDLTLALERNTRSQLGGRVTRTGTTWGAMRQPGTLPGVKGVAGLSKGGAVGRMTPLSLRPSFLGSPMPGSNPANIWTRPMKGPGQYGIGPANLSSLVRQGKVSLSPATGGAKIGAKGLGAIGKKIPGLGLLLGLGFAASRLMEGDTGGAGMELASGALSTIPGLGTLASIGIDAAIIKRDLDRLKDGPPVNAGTPGDSGPSEYGRRTTELLEQLALQSEHNNELSELRVQQGERSQLRPSDLLSNQTTA